MFKKQLSLTLLALTLVAALTGIAIWHISDNDRAEYEMLLKSASATDKSLLTYSEQMREGVCKEIWHAPLYYRIESDDSELFFFQQNGEIEAVEQLTNVRCVLQEKLLYEEGKPIQLVRYVEAKNACYNYATQTLEAEDSEVWRYRIEGHTPPLSFKELEPLLHGRAHSLECAFEGENVAFKADHFQAELSREEHVSIESDTLYSEGETLHLHGNVVLENAMGRVESVRARLTYDESYQATQVVLEERVELVNRQTGQYALADLATYYPDREQVVLEGRERRVLFYDTVRQMQLSAPSVRAKRDLSSIQGMGDVRFVFKEEELEQLKERFQWAQF